MKYPKIQSLFKREPKGDRRIIEGDYSLEEFTNIKRWRVLEKIDGCLHYSQKVLTDEGPLPIGKIVNQKLPVKIASYNIKIGTVEYKEIDHYHKEERVRPFVAVWVKSKGKGARPKAIVCTDNHKFFVDDKWVEAKNLKIGTLVKHISDVVSEDIKQLVLGGLLGDSSIYRTTSSRGFTLVHSVKQKEYFNYKAMLFGNLFHEGKGAVGGYEGSSPTKRGNSIINPSLSDFIKEYCEVNNEKMITDKWANSLNPLGIAIWYMDDGSCNFGDLQRPRARIAAKSFSWKEAKLLSKRLEVFGIDNCVSDYKGPVICLSADGTEKLFNLIFPYVPASMKYKIDPRYHDFPCVMDRHLKTNVAIIDTEVLEISDKLPKRRSEAKPGMRYQYDITVKDNSNYFTSGILVHNTNIRIMCERTVDSWSLKFAGRTDNAQIPPKLLEYLQQQFTEERIGSVFKKDAFEVVLFGEGYGAKIQTGGCYSKEQRFVLFDVCIGRRWWMPYDVLVTMAEGLEIPVVPCHGIWDEETIIEYVKSKPDSVFAQEKYPTEGVVAIPEPMMMSRNGLPLKFKLKCKDYKDDEAAKQEEAKK